MADEVTVPSEEGAPPPVDYEAQARKTGWAPQETFRGDKAKWIDAKSWVERGEQFIPFLQAANRDMKGELEELRNRTAEQDRLLRATNKALSELTETSTAQVVETTQATKEKLIEDIVAAHAADDIKKELELRDELAEVNEKLLAAKVKPTPATTDATRGGTPSAVDGTQHPAFKQFLSDNPWFNDDAYMRGAAVSAMGVLNETAEGRAMTVEERFQRVAQDVKKRFGMVDNSRRSAPSKVEGGRMEGGTGGGSGSKSYNDMPVEAKTVCDRLAKRFVGKPNGSGDVRFKDLNAYRANYAKDYFADDWGNKISNQ